MIGTERFGGYVSEIVSNSKSAPLRVLVGLEIHLQGASILNLGRFDQFRLFSDIDPWLPEHLIKKAKEGNKYLEVISGMSWWFPHSEVDCFTKEYTAFIRHGFDEGVSFSIGSDAHCVHGVGNTVWSRKILSPVGATCDDIIKV